ncbi:hypothetical protein PMAYCL1PPCAC_32750, partial [Pristionchus mayeri]
SPSCGRSASSASRWVVRTSQAWRRIFFAALSYPRVRARAGCNDLLRRLALPSSQVLPALIRLFRVTGREDRWRSRRARVYRSRGPS